MAGKYAELCEKVGALRDNMAAQIANQWESWKNIRAPKEDEWLELRNYIFATDTRSTSTQQWKNSTTTPKLCQIRDNLHANYLSTLLPNDNWLRWVGETETDQQKAAIIEAYMRDKAHQSRLRNTLSQLLLDYIDYGNCFATVYYTSEKYTLPNGREITGYQGPVAHRISPYDIVFNPLAPSFSESPKIVRSIKGIGEIKELAEKDEKWAEAWEKMQELRHAVSGYDVTNWHKSVGFEIDGFGDIKEYFGGQYVEVLVFKGDFFDKESYECYKNREIIVVDRSFVAYNGPNDSWLGSGDIVHGGWRLRPDNLYGMGPLDNLVGMQYRIDHLENLKADAQDLMIHPPLKIQGDVEPFEWGPGEEIRIIGDGDVEEFGKNLSPVAMANNEIAMLEQKMEEFAGAPRQAMGIRTPGEKTMYEVQALQNAAGRIFQEKVTNFEVNVFEPLLNLMLGTGRAKLEGMISVRSINSEIGVEEFLNIQPEDLVAYGTVRPVGARHFGEQAQLIQNITQLFSSPLGQMITPHWSAEKTAKLVEDSMNLGRYGLVRKEVGLQEQADLQDTQNHLSQVVTERQAAPT